MTPIRPLSRDEVRSIDVRAAEIGLPTIVLMENAGRGAADWLDRAMPAGSRVLIACGPGNNGGDGAVVARHLDARGRSVRVAWFAASEAIRGDASVQRSVLENSGLAPRFLDGPIDPGRLAELCSEADWIVDALLGTGLTRPISGPLAEAIAALNDSGRPILALDLPSGLDADTGRPLGVAVRATATVTFVAPKLGFSEPGAGAFTGPVHVVEIGVPRTLLERFGGRESAP